MGRHPKTSATPPLDGPEYDKDFKEITNPDTKKAMEALQRLRDATSKYDAMSKNLEEEMDSWKDGVEGEETVSATYTLVDTTDTTSSPNTLLFFDGDGWKPFHSDTTGMTYTLTIPINGVEEEEEEEEEEDLVGICEDTTPGNVTLHTPGGEMFLKCDDGDLIVEGGGLKVQVKKIHLWGMEIDEDKGRFFIKKVLPFATATAFMFWWLVTFMAMWLAYKGFNLEVAIKDLIETILNI
jgi:hypothetical protein